MTTEKIINKTLCVTFAVGLFAFLGCDANMDVENNNPDVDIKKNITIPTVDISGVVREDDIERHVVIASGARDDNWRPINLRGVVRQDDMKRQVVVTDGTGNDDWQHPHTLLMPDGKTMFATWTHSHGGPAGPLKRSDDGGLTWSDFLDVPENWSTVKDCPTIHRLVDPKGVERLFVFVGTNELYQSLSEDGGKTWSPMQPNGWEGWVAPMSVISVDNGKKYLAWNHTAKPDGDILQSASYDGGLTWEKQVKPFLNQTDFPNARMTEPAVIRSPDGSQLLMLIRESHRLYNSFYATSDDEGRTWSKPCELPAALTGDRHAPKYAPDGRLVIAMREIRPTGGIFTTKYTRDKDTIQYYKGHPVAWVGRYEDIIEGREGEYIIKLFHQHDGSFGYQQVESLPDGNMVVTTYLRYRPGENHSIVATRFNLDEIDKRLYRNYAVGEAQK